MPPFSGVLATSLSPGGSGVLRAATAATATSAMLDRRLDTAVLDRSGGARCPVDGGGADATEAGRPSWAVERRVDSGVDDDEEE